jgi:hypothetical protein
MAGYDLGLGALSRASEILAKRKLAALEERMEGLRGRGPELREAAAEKIRSGALLTRKEAAEYLDVSTKKIQRMESAGALMRCPGLGSVVRYAARDVLRLASAPRKER